MIQFIQNIVRYRYVLHNFVVRDMKVKYRGTVFGYLWSLLEPLSFVGIYWFVFVVIAKRGGPEYPLQVVLGILPFQFFSLVVSGGAGALVGDAPLIRRVYLPREIFVVGQLVSQMVVLLLSLIVVVPFMFMHGALPGWRLVGLPVGLFLLSLYALGIALVLSCLQAVYRDVSYVLRVVLRLALYVTPVIYTLDMVPLNIRGAYLLNPLVIYISLIRSSVMNQSYPFDVSVFVYGVACAIISLWFGSWLFRQWIDRAVKYL
ncbi:MAG: ABC transporter permease [Myxococcales bacterium]|nr:ABC transporter permease [Myxococcales bacterium]